MKRILVIGSKGMAGHVIKQYLSQKGLYTVGDIARHEDAQYNLDVTNIEALDNAIRSFAPDVVVNCIGVLNQFAERNPDQAILLNSFLPHHLAQLGTELGYRLMHISTDCIFSGKKGWYTETDAKDGSGYYAQSKMLGEVDYGAHVTLRTSIIGPELKRNGIGLLNWFLTNPDAEIKGYMSAYWSGVTTIELAKKIEHLIDQPEVTGIVHVCNNERISKHDVLTLFREIFGRDVIIKQDYAYVVDKSLINTRFGAEIGLVPSYRQMIADMKQWMEDHRDLYSANYRF